LDVKQQKLRLLVRWCCTALLLFADLPDLLTWL
jgi:hypothetical protein